MSLQGKPPLLQRGCSLLWVIPQCVAGCPLTESEEGARCLCSAHLDRACRMPLTASSVEGWLSSGGGQGLVENHCSLSPTHPAQALLSHVHGGGNMGCPHTRQTRATAVGLHCSSANQMVGIGFWSFSLPEPCCLHITDLSLGSALPQCLSAL